MAQITWRNINNPNFAGGTNTIQAGNQALLSGINQLANVGQDLEERQRQGNTAHALQQIQMLDEMGLQQALTNPNFIPEGNVDQITLRDALAGQRKIIDQRADYDYNQAQKRIERADETLVGKAEAEIAGGTATEQSIKDLGLSPAREADMLDVLRSRTRTEAEFQRTQQEIERADTNRVQREQGMGIISNALNSIDSVLGQGVSLERARRGLRKDLADAGNDPTEVSSLMKVFDENYEDANKLSAESQAQLERLNLDSDDVIQAEFNREEREVDLMEAALKPLEKPLSNTEKNKASVQLMDKASDIAADNSAIPIFSDEGIGGTELKGVLNDLLDQGHSPTVLELAMVSTAQTDAEAWGDPVVLRDAMIAEVQRINDRNESDGGREAVQRARADLESKRDNLARLKRAQRATNLQQLRDRNNSFTLRGAFN